MQKLPYFIAIIFLMSLLVSYFGMASAYAQNDVSIENYVPPPMFADQPDASALKKPIMKNKQYSSIISGTNDILPPIQAARPMKQIKHIKPPLPPRRPSKFVASPDLLNRIKNPDQTPSVMPDKSQKPVSNALPTSEDRLEIVTMSVDEIYRNIRENGLE